MHVPVHGYLKILTRLSLKLLQLLDYAAGDNLRTSSGDNKTTPLHLAVSIMIMNIFIIKDKTYSTCIFNSCLWERSSY